MKEKLIEFFDNIIENYQYIPIRVKINEKWISEYLDKIPLVEVLKWIKFFIDSRNLDQ